MPSRSVLALVDTSPVLLLPSLFASRARAGDEPLHVSLAGPTQSDPALHRLVTVLGRRGISASVQDRGASLEATVTAWLDSVAADGADPVLDFSSASGGTAARALLAVQRTNRRCVICWFSEADNEVHVSSGGPPEAYVIDVGSRRSVPSAISPYDFMAIFGLERALEDPYCGVSRERLVPAAARLLQIAIEHPGDYRQFRPLLGAARARANCPIARDAIPERLRSLVTELAEIEGWIRAEDDNLVLCGASDRTAMFFLSGGWLEVIVSEAIRRALPDHKVQTNCAATWGRRSRAEAEMDVAFVYRNALYLLSCKNEHLTERFFPHLDRFRALTAEFGESRTRPVLLSTTALEKRHVKRCDAYEIGAISGPILLDLIDRSLHEEPDALLKGLLTVSRGAPHAGA